VKHNRPSPGKIRGSLRAIFPIFLLLAALLPAAAGCSNSLGRLMTKSIACDSAPGAEYGGGIVARQGRLEKAEHADGFVAFSLTAPPAAEEKEAPRPRPAKNRLIIYTADLRLKVANLENARTRFLDLVESIGGYLQRQEDQTITCRVPAGTFKKTVAAVKELGSVLAESMHASDVTREFFDLEIRLDNAEKSRDRLLDILKRADKVTDLIEIERELKRLSGEIEGLKGQLRYMKDQIAFSTLTVTFNGPAPMSQPRSRVYNRFDWINRIGVKYVLDRF
jgi:hypothetical protein